MASRNPRGLNQLNVFEIVEGWSFISMWCISSRPLIRNARTYESFMSAKGLHLIFIDDSLFIEDGRFDHEPRSHSKLNVNVPRNNVENRREGGGNCWWIFLIIDGSHQLLGNWKMTRRSALCWRPLGFSSSPPSSSSSSSSSCCCCSFWLTAARTDDFIVVNNSSVKLRYTFRNGAGEIQHNSTKQTRNQTHKEKIQ